MEKNDIGTLSSLEKLKLFNEASEKEVMDLCKRTDVLYRNTKDTELKRLYRQSMDYLEMYVDQTKVLLKEVDKAFDKYEASLSMWNSMKEMCAIEYAKSMEVSEIKN